MQTPTDILILLAFLSEVVFLGVLEKKMWGTIYTPLNIVMLPTALVVLISVWVVSQFDLYPFYAPSLFVWMSGLFFFSIPSVLMRKLTDGSVQVTKISLPDLPAPKLVFCAGMFICLLFLFHMRSAMSATTSAVGSDEFADEVSTHGFWGHLFCLVIFSNILSTLYISKKRWYFVILLLLGLIVCVINQVKSWVLIPLFAGILLNIFTGRLRLSWRLLLLVALGGSSFFFLSYYLSLVVSVDKELTDNVVFFIFKNFAHYVTSGVLGLSMDMDKGIVETPDVGYLFVTFVNIYNAIVGEPLQSAVNPAFLGTSWPTLGTNIRTLMGTAYVFSGPWLFPVVIMVVSSAAYLIRVQLLRTLSLSWLLVDGWMSAILAMGWFDWDFFHLRVYEVFMLCGFFPIVYHFFFPDKESIDVERQPI